MPRREPDGDTDVEALASEIQALRARLADLEAFVAGKLPHNHDSRYDGRYVHESGDTMSGDLTWTSGHPTVERTDSNGDVWTVRLDIVGDNDSPRLNVRKNGALHAAFRWDESNGQWQLGQQLQVEGTIHSLVNKVLQRNTLAWSPKIEVSSPGGSSERWELYGSPDHGGLLRIFTNDFTRDYEFRVHNQGGSGSHGRAVYIYDTGDVECFENFDVVGTKNALISDPDDPTRAFRFGAFEFDEPGMLGTRVNVTIPDGSGKATTPLPEHWARIATDPDAWATPKQGDATEQRDGRAWPRAHVDLTVPEVAVHGPPGDYRVWVMAARADAGVDGWTHEVEVTPDDEDV